MDPGRERPRQISNWCLNLNNIGAEIMGRNKFGPVRGPWPDLEWKGWWGDTPPFHTPVFVLTHHARKPLEMEGGTTFHFVTNGPAPSVSLSITWRSDRSVAEGELHSFNALLRKRGLPTGAVSEPATRKVE